MRSTFDRLPGPTLVPVSEEAILLIDALEAPSFQRRLLRIADCGLDLAFEIVRVWPTGQRNDAVVCEHRGIKSAADRRRLV